MLRIDCPYCGLRDHTEFTYVGDASRTYPGLDGDMRTWVDYVPSCVTIPAGVIWNSGTTSRDAAASCGSSATRSLMKSSRSPKPAAGTSRAHSAEPPENARRLPMTADQPIQNNGDAENTLRTAEESTADGRFPSDDAPDEEGNAGDTPDHGRCRCGQAGRDAARRNREQATMREQPFRRHGGGLIDRSRPLRFSFDGTEYVGYHGDTLASALLANGVRLVGRSFKYHRPRGVYTAGSEEPNAMVTLRTGGRSEPNTKATMIELYDGLVAFSQNRWPSLKRDVLAINSLVSPLLPAGFYYKTFIWPGQKGWMFYEKFIRRAAGLGAASRAPDPDQYEKCHAFCDVMIVGGGPAGLAAARAAGHSGARVILVDEGTFVGGSLLGESSGEEDELPAAFAMEMLDELAGLVNVTIMTRTTAFGLYDNNVVGLLERVEDHKQKPAEFMPRQRTWTVRARKIILATGATERPIVFPNNDRPGIMLAGAARRYANQYGVLPGLARGGLHKQ